MAETTTTKAAPKTAETKPAAPNGETAKKEKAKKVPYKEVFATAEEAIKEAEGREKGPRSAFKCELNGKVVFCVANNEGRAGGIAYAQAGGKVEGIGKVKKSKAVGADGILAAINALPEDQRAAVMEQLKGLKK